MNPAYFLFVGWPSLLLPTRPARDTSALKGGVCADCHGVFTLPPVARLVCICAMANCVTLASLQAGNQLGDEEAKVLAPELGKLTQLHTLDLCSE